MQPIIVLNLIKSFVEKKKPKKGELCGLSRIYYTILLPSCFICTIKYCNKTQLRAGYYTGLDLSGQY